MLTLRYAPGSPRRFGAPAYPHRVYRPAGDPIGSPRRFGAPAYPHRIYRPAGDPIGSPPRCGAPAGAQAPPAKENRPSFDSRQDSLVSGV